MQPIQINWMRHVVNDPDISPREARALSSSVRNCMRHKLKVSTAWQQHDSLRVSESDLQSGTGGDWGHRMNGDTTVQKMKHS